MNRIKPTKDDKNREFLCQKNPKNKGKIIIKQRRRLLNLQPKNDLSVKISINRSYIIYSTIKNNKNKKTKENW